MSLNNKQKIILIRGDGIGPEICDSVVNIFAAVKIPFEWVEVEAGLGAIKKQKTPLTREALDEMKKYKISLKAPTTTPIGGGHQSINVMIRKSLDLYVNVRPIKSIPGLKTPFKGVDLVVVRENIEDTYSGIEHMQSNDVGQCLRIITRSGSERCHRYAFEMARREKRKKVTCVHKANIMKLTDGIFLDSFREVAKEYPDIENSEIIVDNCCMQLVQKPQQFDVLVLTNLFGDIVSDLCAGLVGGLGVAAGANIGKNYAVFEAVHGSAPDIAGKGIANPTALLCSAIMMLRHLGFLKEAQTIEKALFKTLGEVKNRTGDLGGKANTKKFTKAIVDKLK